MFEALDLPADPGLSLVVYTADLASPSHDALNLLASWAAPPSTRPTRPRQFEAAHESDEPRSWRGCQTGALTAEGLAETKGTSMEYRRLGSPGLQVSRIALGCMSFGDTHAVQRMVARRRGCPAVLPTGRRARHHLLGHRQRLRLRQLGGDRRPSTEEVHPPRRHRPGHQGVLHDARRPGGSGLSRKAIMEQIDASLTRLGTDYVDLYQIHRFDPDTPVEETMEALHDVVKAGKARYLGASSMWAWQFAKMQYAADLHGWTRFVSMQDQYNLCNARKSARCSACSPTKESAASRTARLPRDDSRGRGANTPPLRHRPVGRRFDIDSDRPIVEAVQQVAEARGVPMAQVALAWVLKNPVVTAPIVGATKPHHLRRRGRRARHRAQRRRSPRLEEHYGPHLPTAF